MQTTLITTVSDLKSELLIVVKTAMQEFKNEAANERRADTLYTINQVRKRLGKSHKTIKNLVLSGVIKSTASGLISEAALNDYLKKS